MASLRGYLFVLFLLFPWKWVTNDNWGIFFFHFPFFCCCWTLTVLLLTREWEMYCINVRGTNCQKEKGKKALK